MRRLVSVLIACIAAAMVPMASGGATEENPPPPVYDDYLLDHLDHRAVVRAQRFVARQTRLGSRPARSELGEYGRPGCAPPPEYEVGAERQFWVNQEQSGSQQITAVLAARSSHGYMWVQREFYFPGDGDAPEGGFVTRSEAEEGLRDWEQIYETDITYFGDHPSVSHKPAYLAPGLPADWRDADCDEHVHILNFPIDAGTGGGFVAGYFSSEHEYPNGEGEHESPYSNEAEMFFMNSLFLNVGDDTYAGVIAHEFFHMIQFSNDFNEATWVNEGMADIAAVVNGFSDVVEGHIGAYEQQPDNHLLDWGGGLEDYGQAFLLFDYLFQHYGEKDDPATEFIEPYGLADDPDRDPSGRARRASPRSSKHVRRL